jgi:hypothetical protein
MYLKEWLPTRQAYSPAREIGLYERRKKMKKKKKRHQEQPL